MSHPPAHATPSPHDDEVIAPHGVDDHGDDGGHDDHAHEDEPLGPVDVVAWIYGGLGVVLGLIVALGFAIAAGWTAIG